MPKNDFDSEIFGGFPGWANSLAGKILKISADLSFD
jgi:hypothetical protein